MIFPEPREDLLHQKGIAFISTLVFAVLGFIFLSISDLHIEKASREVFRKIDMSSLMPASLRLSEVDLDQSSAFDAHVQLYGMPSSTIESPAASDNEEKEETASNAGSDIENQRVPERQDNQPVRPVPNKPDTQTDPVTQPSPEPQQTAQRDEDKPAQPEENSQSSNARAQTTRATNNPAPSNSNPVVAEGSVPRLPLEAFGSDYKSLQVREIISWMQNNPAELPKGIRQLVRFRPAFLSSVTNFTMDGKDYELYLMCKESLFEVHVVLVEDDEATYLVDRSFQKLSTYLRKGQVRRTQDNQIIAVRSNMASNDSSDEFYSLFLSWWDWAK